MIVGGNGSQRQPIVFDQFSLEQAVDTDVVADDRKAVFVQKLSQI